MNIDHTARHSDLSTSSRKGSTLALYALPEVRKETRCNCHGRL